MIKLKDILKEASLSPSYNKMYRGWTVLHDVLGPQSKEYSKLVKSPVFTNFFRFFQRPSQLENCWLKYEYLTFNLI